MFLRSCNIIEKRFQHKCFPLKLVKKIIFFCRTPMVAVSVKESFKEKKIFPNHHYKLCRQSALNGQKNFLHSSLEVLNKSKTKKEEELAVFKERCLLSSTRALFSRCSYFIVIIQSGYSYKRCRAYFSNLIRAVAARRALFEK